MQVGKRRSCPVRKTLLLQRLAFPHVALDKLAGGIEPQLIVILSDINMPVMDGLELLREIKTRRPDLPVMMVSAYGDDERRRLAGEYGAAEFITKPVDFDLLKTQLRDLSGVAH
jgi:CheY-like chemotaxis protein